MCDSDCLSKVFLYPTVRKRRCEMNRSFLSDPSIRLKAIWGFAMLVAVAAVVCVFVQFGPVRGVIIAQLIVMAGLGVRIFSSGSEIRTKELMEAGRVHLATVEALATAIDARDQVGKGHVRRTQIYAVAIGKLMGLGPSDIDALRTGALLHDIGKLAVPDHILNKPGSLTKAELEKTKIHPVVGAAILEKVGFDYPVVPTVRYHHESWDGSGYPDKLEGAQIPLTARILSVADAFDTLRGARPYRPAMSREDARNILRKESGTRFDPTVVNVLLAHLVSIEAEIDAAGLSYQDSEVAKTHEVQNYVEQIKLANREVFSLYELAREFSSSVTLSEILEMFAKKNREFVPLDTCFVYLLDEESKVATAAHVAGLNREMLESRRIRTGQGATGYALKMRQTVQNVDPSPDFAGSNTECADLYSTMASVPLIAEGDKLLGALTIYSCEETNYGQENIRLMETISRIASAAIDKSLKHIEVKAHALTDPMTGLPNARSLKIQFEKEVARSTRGNSSFKVLMLDLDGFKAVNDSFGHKVGDEMLCQIARVIREQLRDYDFLARYGGDEFVALIPETTPVDVVELCSRIEKAVRAFSLNVSENKFASVGVSLGASGYPGEGETFDQMIVAADRAMYECKANRKRVALTNNVGRTEVRPPAPAASPISYTEDTLIVELDETHVITSAAVN